MLKSKLSYISLLIAYRSPKNIELPVFQGSTIRGVFGKALKSAFCVMHHRDCEKCLVKDSCGYFDIFESIDGKSSLKLKGMEKKPHPYILIPPEKNIYLKDEIFYFRMTLLGNDLNRIPYLLYAFEKMGNLGFGKSREKLELFMVKDGVSGKVIMENGVYYKENLSLNQLHRLNEREGDYLSNSLLLRWMTPVKLVRDGKVVRQLDSVNFQRAIYRRFTMVHRIYGILDESDLEDLSLLEIVPLDSNFKEWNRYSNRQKRKVKMEGISGMLRVFPKTRKNLELLTTLRILHLGKATAFGLGRYKLRG